MQVDNQVDQVDLTSDKIPYLKYHPIPDREPFYLAEAATMNNPIDYNPIQYQRQSVSLSLSVY